MEILIEALRDAVELIAALDPGLIAIVILTLQVTLAGLFLSILIGLPIGVLLGLSSRIPSRAFLLPLIYTGMGLPPVLVGLFVYLMLSNAGPLGNLGWLFTPSAMIAAQMIIGLPLIIGLTLSAIKSIDPLLPLQLRALGATRLQLSWTMLSEARFGLFAAIVAAFGSILSEVGAVMLVGGNIEGETRVLTTAIVLETRKGNFSLALALGFILLTLAFTTNFGLYLFQQQGTLD